MLTGDENIVDVDFVVLWKIKPDAEPANSCSTSSIRKAR